MFDLSDNGRGILGRLLVRVEKVLAPNGWRLHLEGGELNRWGFVREQGAIRQHLQFFPHVGGSIVVAISNDPEVDGAHLAEPRMQFNVWVGFSSELIGDALRKLLPEDAAYLDEARSSGGIFHRDVYRGLVQVFANARGLYGEWLYGDADVDAQIDGFCSWYLEHGAKALDECRDLPALNRLVHSPWALHEAPWMWPLQHMLATLAIVHLCDDPKVSFLDWLGIVRRAQREGTKSAAEIAILERLIDRVRRRRPANA